VEDLAERINTIFGRHNIRASKLIEDEGLTGPKAEKVFLAARVDALQDACAEIVRDIKEVRTLL
jgi:hypothetical protein